MDISELEKKLGIDGMSADEQMAMVIALQKSAEEKSKQARDETIGKSAELVIQGLKKIKSDIETRFTELNTTIQGKVTSLQDGKDGRDGKDGKNGLDGKQGVQGIKGQDGRNGQDGVDGVDGISVTSAHIDFDGSLIIGLSSGVELNVGEVVAPDLAERIKVITNGGGTSQSVLDTLTSLQSQINALIPSQTGNSGKYLTTNGTSTSWATITGSLSYQGTWNASTNSPTLASSVGTQNNYYIVGTSGSTSLNGITDWVVGDWLIFNGSVWQKIDTTDLVVSVAGRTGAVTLTTADVSGLGTIATQASSNVSITGGSITGITDLAVADGGTGASTASGARTNLGLVIGTDVLAPTGSAASLTGFPTFNQNTTGSAATLTTGRTIAITGDLTYTSASFNGSANVTGAGTLATVNTNVGSFTNASVTVNGKGLITAASSGTAPVTSVTGTSPVASSGGVTPAISLESGYGDTLNPYASKTAKYVLAAPNGASGVPTFRALVASDVPTLNQDTTGSAGSLVTTNFSIVQSGTKLLFKYGATTIASMDSTGIITSATNIVANGTP
jgi:hypothetical protein